MLKPHKTRILFLITILALVGGSHAESERLEIGRIVLTAEKSSGVTSVTWQGKNISATNGRVELTWPQLWVSF